ncbi:DUF2929 family protein [Melghiribacillus thermohalophilus]|uniref:DUF2929 family protein n=1 Tax=Melghiribacillus thermohalophilus TaxID=1324956 RepID=A0A4V2V1T5_9BACI|nr:DUF2929 family protein [Melghiribacillus thermohalophilus]TCT22432.1 DUF2929 family protein [Melghiribacillus thermohalophilus]
MRLFWTIIWSFLLSSMVVYVVSSMTGAHFDLTLAIVLSITFTVASVVLGEGLLKQEDVS